MRKVLIPAICVLALFVNPTIVYSAEKIVLTTQVWAPYQTYENKLLGGFAVHVVQCVLEKMNQPYEIKVYPWKRAQKMVENGEAQGFFSASQNHVRDEYATISETIAAQKWNWYLLKESSFTPSDISFKKEAKVSAMLGSNMLTWLTKNEYRVMCKPVDTEKLLETLLMKRHDAVLANELVAEKTLAKMNLSSDRFKIYLNKDKPLGVYWSKKFLSTNPGFLEQFNKYTRTCRH